MKKILMYIFLIYMFYIGLNTVVAEEYTCNYSAKNFAWDGSLSYKIEGNGNASFNSNAFGFMDSTVNKILDFDLSDRYKNLSSEEKLAELVRFFDGKCQNEVLICEGADYSDGHGHSDYAVLFDIQYESDAWTFAGSVGVYDKEYIYSPTYVKFSGNNNCFMMSLQESSTGTSVNVLNNTCDKYNEFLNGNDVKKIKPLSEIYTSCKKNDDKICDEYNVTKTNLFSYCSSVIQYGNYNNPCMVSCLGLNDDINNIEKESIVESSCNVSDRIIKWVANIVKWVKYIAPVLVIILGILDFIKAFASGNDDEMKKVKARFVKRLISAALLFIVPFIIEFVLDVFNLVTDNPYCNLF